jgi:hypothetical protein
MNIEQEIQNILDRNFTRGDNAKALKELLVLYNVVGRSEQLLAFAKHLQPKEDVSLLMNEVSVFIHESK